MMMSLFSIFDPSNSMMMQLNWIFLFMMFFLLPNLYWVISSRYEMIYIKFIMWIFNEFNSILKQKYIILFFISQMMMILIINFFSLFPYIFTLTSHLSFSLTFSLPLWTCLMLYGWINFFKKMLAHLVPLGTPYLLMMFMVMIETISNIIRPLTLSVRLSANMIAGHLLLALLGETGMSVKIYILFFILIIEIMLMILEMSVAIIQSYVFAILTLLYTNEI